MPYKKLPRSFYLQPTVQVAQQLLGKYLIRPSRGENLIGRIVEAEAYLGHRDPASHAYRGVSKRNAVMFRTGGHAYVYFTYGMHFCFNVVTEEEGTGHAVLLRALEPISGVGIMRRRRRVGNDLINLCNGPAKLCQAFGINRSQNGADLCSNEIWLAQDVTGPRTGLHIRRSTRIGITLGREHRWRFYLNDNPFVSRGKPVEG